MKMEKILISESSNNSDELYAVVYGNSNIMDFLLKQDVNVDDLHPDALASYYVDYYFSQANSAGFSKFVHSSQWNSDMNARIAYGLKEIKSFKHLVLFNERVEAVNKIPSDKLESFLEQHYDLDSDLKTELDEDKSFYWIDDDIVDLNGQWLKEHQDKEVLSMDNIFLELEKVLGRPIQR